MKKINTKFNFKQIYSIFASLLFSIIVSTSVLSSLVNSSANALTINGGQDCSSNSVIDCGVQSTSELSTYLPGHTAILDLYASSPFNINQDDLNNINNTSDTGGQDYTVSGTVDINNNVIVNGKVVATNAITAGRVANSQDIKKESFGGYTFYLRHPSASFLTTSIDAFVVMKNGVFQFAILTPCGNPVSATPVPTPVTPVMPSYKCLSLTITPSSSDPNTVAFAVTDSATGGAVLKDVTYNINNTTTNSQASTTGGINDTYTFTTYGSLTVSAVVSFTVNGSVVTDSGSGSPNPCVKSYTTAAPSNGIYSCNTIAVTSDPSNANGIIASNTYTASNGATLTGVDYNFGDSSTQAITDLTNLTTNHTYAAPGQYTVSVADTFSYNGNSYTVSSPNCVNIITIAAPPSTPQCTIPGLTEYAANSPDCVVAIVPTTKLVNTGPGGVGTFLIILGVAAVISGGSYYFLGKKRNQDPLDSL